MSNINRLVGITVCVNYADLLARSIDRWCDAVDELIIVTTESDAATRKLGDGRPNVQIYTTDVFYANGAKFNKGAALSEAAAFFDLPAFDRWILAFDADIVPPIDLRPRLEQLGPRPGNLYGARRYYVPEAGELVIDESKLMPQGWVIGFFMLFNASDRNVGTPLFDVDFPHCGSYDTTFCRRWDKANQIILPLKMIHLGEERQNWFGRGETELMRQMTANRRAGHSWEFERMTNPPAIADPLAGVPRTNLQL